MNEIQRQRILDEQNFPYMGMTLEQRDYYLNIIKNCKDIADTKHKVGKQNKCNLLQLRLNQTKNEVYINGILVIEDKEAYLFENRCIDGYLFIENNCIIVDMHITRLCIQDDHKEYRVLDQFKLDGNILKRTSSYNYEGISYDEELKTDLLKGRKK